jgi:hypothetical protein
LLHAITGAEKSNGLLDGEIEQAVREERQIT